MTRAPLVLGTVLAGLLGLAACTSEPAPKPDPAPKQEPAPKPEPAKPAPAKADEPPLEKTGIGKILILHTNDVHGQVLPISTRQGKRGGYPALVSRLRAERDAARAAGWDVLTLDGGDIFAGTPEGDMTDGRLIVDLMNLVGFDAWELGNHEFDHGVANVKELCARAKFPVLAANLKDEKTGERPDWVKPSIRKRVAGLDVCVIGLMTAELKRVTTRKGSAGVDAGKEEEAVEKELSANATAQVFILLTHIGKNVDDRLGKKFGDKLHVIVGGHSHTPIPEPRRVPEGTGPLVVQAGSNGKWLGRAEVEIDRATAKLTKASGRLIDIDPEKEKPAEDVKKVLEEGSREVSKLMDVKVGALSAPMHRGGGSSSALGNFLTDVMRQHTGADVAVHNKTGIRAELEGGEVTMRHLHQVSPFGNTVVTMSLTGAELQELIENQFRPKPMFELSGVVVKYDSKAGKGKHVVSIEVGGKPLDPTATYRVATNSFLADSGDGHSVFGRGRDKTDDGTTLLDMSRTAFEGKTLAPLEEKRLHDVHGGDKDE